MTEFRFFGRFNPELNKPDSSDNSQEISETEAKTRYFDRSARLDIVPVLAPDAGKVPYFIQVATAEKPGFTVYTCDDSGFPLLEEAWASQADGKLFLLQMIVRRYDLRNWSSIVPRTGGDWDSQVVLNIKQDGRVFIRATEQENGRLLPDSMSAQTETDPRFLFRDPPEWGRWDELLESPVDLAGFGLAGDA